MGDQMRTKVMEQYKERRILGLASNTKIFPLNKGVKKLVYWLCSHGDSFTGWYK